MGTHPQRYADPVIISCWILFGSIKLQLSSILQEIILCFDIALSPDPTMDLCNTVLKRFVLQQSCIKQDLVTAASMFT